MSAANSLLRRRRSTPTSPNPLLRRRQLSSTPTTFAPSRLSRDDKYRDWANNLGDRPANLIGDYVLANDVADYVRFRTVCGSWRGNTDDPRQQSVLDPRFHPRHWILLPENAAGGAQGSSRRRRRMLNVTTGAHINVDLPDLEGDVLVAPGRSGSPGGILVLIDEHDLVVRLLNPLTGQYMDLPPVTPVLSRRRRGRLDIMFFKLCKVTGAGFVGESTVVLHFGWDDRLVSTWLGHDRWEVISKGSALTSAFPFNGNVYFANAEDLMMVDTDSRPPTLVTVASLPTKDRVSFVHMADNAGELVVVDNMVRFHENDENDYTVRFEVFRLDAATGALIPVSHLGGKRSLFAGDYCGALVASSQGIMPNTIYFQHDRYNTFYVRHIFDDGSSSSTTSQLVKADKGSFVDELTSYVRWNGSKTRVAAAADPRDYMQQLALLPN